MALRLIKPKRISGKAKAVAAWGRETFVVPAGISRGQPFELHPFQLEFLSAHLEQVDGSPRYRTSVLSLPRKTGKSTFMGFLLLARMLPDSPIFIPMFKAVCVAPTARFAKFVPQAAVDLMTAVGREDEIALRHAPSPGRLVVGNGQCQLLSGDSKSGHGDDVDLAILDEAGLFPRRQDELFDATFNALAARDGSQILTGTRLDGPKFTEILEAPDDATHVALYAADKNADPGDPAQWEKATPGGFKIKAKAFIRDAFEKAKASGNLEDFKTSHLNLRGNPARELLVTYDTLQNCYDPTAEPEPGEACFVGLDLGGSSSMSAACAVYESGLVKAIGAFPGEAMTLHERGKRDRVGTVYTDCEAEGSLFTTPGRITDLDAFLPMVAKMIGPHPVINVSCDRYRREDLLNALARAKLDWQPVFRGQGPRDGDADIRATRKLFLSGTLRMQRSRLIEAGIAEADVRVHATGAMQLVKSSLMSRIDVCQALVLAASALYRERDAVTPEFEIEVI